VTFSVLSAKEKGGKPYRSVKIERDCYAVSFHGIPVRARMDYQEIMIMYCAPMIMKNAINNKTLALNPFTKKWSQLVPGCHTFANYLRERPGDIQNRGSQSAAIFPPSKMSPLQKCK